MLLPPLGLLLWMLYAFVWDRLSFFSQPEPQERTLSPHFCFDPEDPVEWLPYKDSCTCPDPSIPVSRTLSAWQTHHKKLVKLAANAHNKAAVDVVLLGDSITERWMGTRTMGQKKQFTEYKQLFDSFFNTEIFSSVALGSSGDICTELLWHLQNGWLPESLQPKVFLVLIGTNDLGRCECSKRTVLAGIMKVLDYLGQQRPHTPLVVHTLLPRNDVYNESDMDYHLGRYWENIEWINQQLTKFGALHDNWHVVDNNDLFLNRVGGTNHEWIINQTLMTDALHPSFEGYQAWAPKLVETIRAFV